MRAIACLIAALLSSACRAEVKDAPGGKAKAPVARTLQKPRPSPAPAVFAAIDTARARYATRSLVSKFALIPIDTVPRIERSTEDNGCGDWGVIDPKSAGGKLAQSRGWKVSSEARLGRLTAVVVLRNYDFYPGAECIPVEGMLLLFERGDVIAALYREIPPLDYPIGWIEAMENGTVRVMASTPQVPFGDLSFDGARILFGPMPAINVECGGRMKVPDVFRMKIDDARRKLVRAGWKPVKQRHAQPKDPTMRDPTYFKYRDRGIVEWESCGGGGWCQFHYTSRAGALVLVTGPASEASGLMEWVISYSPECRGAGSGRG